MFHLSSQFGSWIEKAFTCISVPRPSRITSLMVSLSMATDMAVRTLRARSILASLPYSPIHGCSSSGRYPGRLGSTIIGVPTVMPGHETELWP